MILATLMETPHLQEAWLWLAGGIARYSGEPPSGMCEARAPHGVMETHSPGPLSPSLCPPLLLFQRSCPSVHGFAHSWTLHLIRVRFKVTTD